MKHHPAWLAAGLLIFAVLACNLSSNKNGANNSNGSNRPPNAEVYVDQLNMAKDDNGDPGASTTSFSPSERTVHVVITLNKGKPGTQVRVAWIAAEVEGAKNKELKTLDYTTKGTETKIPGYLRWSQDWPRGDYKVEVYINGVLDKTVNYTVS
jgi:hypothetical protein